mgnify:CR=1 FL=1
MSSANVVFMGNLLYPEGLAETKRFQHFIDAMSADPGNAVRVLLLRQSHPGRAGAGLSGEHRGITYATIGQDIGANLGLPVAVLRYLYAGCRQLWAARRPGGHNILFLYNEPNVENVAFVLWAKLLGYRVIVDIVEDSYFIPGDARWISRLKARSSAWATRHLDWFADGVVVISSFLERKLAGILRGRRPVCHVPISVDLDRVVARTGAFHRPVRLLYAGSFGDKDGVEGLIDAFDQLASRWPDLEFVLTGLGQAGRMDEVHRRIARSPFAAKIRYVGRLPDEQYFRLISECDIPCVVRAPSAFADRGFPFKLGEYLATGRPVVASRVSDVERYLVDGVNAMLVDAGSVAGVVSAVEYLLADEARALAIGLAGRRVAEEHFSARTNGRRLLALVESLGER